MNIKAIKKVVYKTKTKNALYCDVTFLVKRRFKKPIEVIKECYIEPNSSGGYWSLCYFSDTGSIIHGFNNTICNLIQRSEVEKEIILI